MKDIVSLRNHLFEQLNRLADATPEEIESEVTRAASIVQVSESIIKTAEVENQFIAITKSLGSGFVPVVNSGQPKSLIKQIEEAAKRSPEDDKVGGTFDVDKEKNWLMDEGSSTSETGIVVHKINKGGSE